jgi:squalene cyclase
MFVSTLLAAALVGTPAASTEAGVTDVRETVNKGLKWLVSQQSDDGSWSGNNGLFTVTTTAYAGLAVLMEGSTLQEGKYAAKLRLTVAWFEKIAQPNGLLVSENDQFELARPMQAHTAALLFLASAYDVDDDAARRKRLRPILDNAMKYAIQGQTRRGGWGVLPAPLYEYDDSASTALMLQALLATDKAGIPVPRGAVEKATKYLLDATNSDGSVNYALVNGNFPQPYATTAATAALLATDRKPSALARWVTYTKRNAAFLPSSERINAAAYNSSALQQYLTTARIVHALGDSGHRTLDPSTKEPDLLRWSPHREGLFKYLKAAQSADGSWPDNVIGTSYGTALTLILLQLDNNYLPAFGR